MSTSGFTPSLPTPSAAPAPSNSADTAGPVRLLRTPQNLDTSAPRGVRITGTVESASNDGTVRIRTQEGPVELRVENPRVLNRLQEAAQQRSEATVDVRISAPREGVAANERQADIVVRPPPAPSTSQTTTRPLATPVSIEVQTQQAAATPQTPPPEGPFSLDNAAPLPAQSFRLEAIPAERVQAYLPAPEIAATTLTPAVDATTVPIAAPDPSSALAPVLTAVAQAAQVSSLPAASFYTALPPLTPSVLTITAPLPDVIIAPAAPPLAPAAGDGLTPALAVQDTAGLPTPLPAELPLPLTSILAASTSLQTPVIQASSLALGTPITTAQTLTPPPLTQATITAHHGTAIVLDAPTLARDGAPNQAIPGTNLNNTILNTNQAGTLTASVVAQTPEGLPILNIPSAASSTETSPFFLLHAPFDPTTPGTTLTLTPSGDTAQLSAQALLSSAPAPVVPSPLASLAFLTPQAWPALNELAATLTQHAPQVAQAFSNMIPSPSTPAQMGPAAMFFMAAIRGGDLQGWLGNKAIDTLRRAGASSTLSKLGQDGAALGRLSSEPLSGDWRGMSIPMAWQNEIQNATIYYKRDESASPDDEDSAGKPVRFVFDLSVNAMGAVQLDSLFRAGRMDMILRTETPFSGPMQQEMRRIYMDALKTSDMSGELSFNSAPDGWVSVIPTGGNHSGVSA